VTLIDVPVPFTSARARRFRVARARFLRRPVAVAALVVVCFFILLAALGPLVTPYDANATDFNHVLGHSSWAHPLGTDQLGRDVLSRIIVGARASLIVAVAATFLSLLIAVPLGIYAGYRGGWVDTTIARMNDVKLAFPSIILAVGLAAILGPSLRNVTLALGIAGIAHFLRVARGETLALREQNFVKAAVVSGAGTWSIVFRHILPNMTSTLLVQSAIHIPGVILAEAALSFLGLGVRPPTPSWGVMVSEGQTYIAMAPRLALYPGAAVTIIALAFNLLGDGLRDALDPKTVR
jgi:ABC-type dipeptide/oligopeptide/nickel transport system permease subunit